MILAIHNIRYDRGDLEEFLLESNTFHIKSKPIKILSCKDFATLLDPPLYELALYDQ